MNIMFSGNHTVKELSPAVIQMIDRIVIGNHKVVVGDCSGVDRLVQDELKARGYNNVRVVHIKSEPRYNAGFEMVQISGKKQTDKDRAMCKWADVGVCVFHRQRGKGGTGRNLDDLQKQGKTAVIVVNEKYEVIKAN